MLKLGSAQLETYRYMGTKNTNDRSMVVHIRYGDRSILFTADIGLTAQRVLATENAEHFKSDILKLPHHGVGGISPQLLDAASPELCFVSNGPTSRDVKLQKTAVLKRNIPLYFTSRCVHLTEFVEAVNLELRSYLLRQQYHRRLSEVRDQAREQYAQLGDLLASAGPAVPASAQAMGYRVASSLRPREGQNVCGDQLDSFEVGGAVYLLLSDGMGSGEAAHREAAMTVRLLRQFLEAGIEPGPALKTLNTALSLRGESGGGFTTIDLLALQRSSGQAALYKYGAAPSYCKRGGSVSRYAGQSLPAGLQAVRDAPECTRLQLTAGSFFVMVSDGIADAGNDEWLQNLLAGWSGRDVNALVSLILAESRGRKGLEDDCAVLALHLSSGEKKPV